MTIEISGNLYPKDSKFVQVKYFEVPCNVSEIHVKFDYTPKKTGNFQNQITLSFYDSMNNFMGRYDNIKNFTIGINGSPSAFKSLPLPGTWKVEIENQSLIGMVNYVIKMDFEGNEEYKWYTGELHTHSIHSDGKLNVKELSDYIKANDFDFFFLTDHNNVTGHDELCANGFPGEELTTFKGHMLVLGANQFIDWKDENGLEKPIKLIKEESHYLHGLLGVAHPFMLSEPICGGCGWKYADNPFDADLFDFVEIWNGVMEPKPINLEAIYSWIGALRNGMHISATSGRDLHSPTDPDGSFWLKNRFLLRRLELSEILYAIKHGMSYLSTDSVTVDFHGNTPGKVIEYDDEAKYKFELSTASSGRVMIFTKNDTLDLGQTYSAEVSLKNISDDDFAVLIFTDDGGTPLLITNPVYFKKITEV